MSAIFFPLVRECFSNFYLLVRFVVSDCTDFQIEITTRQLGIRDHDGFYHRTSEMSRGKSGRVNQVVTFIWNNSSKI